MACSAGWDAPNVAVNLGNNDIGFCGDGGVAECAVTIRYLLDAIGPGHTVWWSKITRPFDLADPYNQALDLVAAERDNLRIVGLAGGAAGRTASRSAPTTSTCATDRPTACGRR